MLIDESPDLVGEAKQALPHPRRDGSTHLLLDPLELIEKLSVLVPSPRFHLLRFQGLLAPHAAWRSQIIPSVRDAVDQEVGAAGTGLRPVAGDGSPPSSGSTGLSWATLMKRVFALDVLLCPRCGGRRQIVGVYPGGQRLRASLPRLPTPVALGLVAPGLSVNEGKGPADGHDPTRALDVGGRESDSASRQGPRGERLAGSAGATGVLDRLRSGSSSLHSNGDPLAVSADETASISSVA